jgi:flagellar FliL protein
MAKKDEKPVDEQAAEVVEEPQKKSKLKLPPFVLYGIIALVVVGAGYFAFTKFFKSTEKADAVKESTEKAEPAHPASVYAVTDIIVNPSGTGGTRFLSVSMGFEVSSEATIKILEEHKPLIRDALITILGSKTMDQLTDPKQKEITRFQIKKRVEQLLHINDLAAVYFTDFILQ